MAQVVTGGARAPEANAKRGVAFVDGQIVPVAEARIPLLDMGFLRSDATYDVVHVWRGSFFRLEDHLDRFTRNIDRLWFRLDLTRSGLKRVLAECVQRAGIEDAYVAMIATRGIPKPGSRDPRTATSRFYAFAVPFIWLASPEKQESGLDLHVSKRLRIPTESVDPTIKNYHWLDLEMALFDAYDRDADTAILIDRDENIVEGPGFNAFVIQSGRLRTPNAGVLEGITRRTVIEIAESIGIPTMLERIPAQSLGYSDEIFVTSTAGGVMPVTRLDGQPIGSGQPGPITTRIREMYWRWHEDPSFATPVASLLQGETACRGS